MAAYIDGNRGAFDDIFRRYAPVVVGMVKRRGGNDDAAKEVTQQTFLQLHRARHDYRRGAALRPWLTTIALNVFREQLRRGGRRREDLDTAAIDAGVDPVADPGADAERAQTATRLRRAIAALPAGQREVILLHWFEGLSFPEIATAIGAGLSAVKVRAHRGYAALRQSLDAEGIGAAS